MIVKVTSGNDLHRVLFFCYTRGIGLSIGAFFQEQVLVKIFGVATNTDTSNLHISNFKPVNYYYKLFIR